MRSLESLRKNTRSCLSPSAALYKLTLVSALSSTFLFRWSNVFGNGSNAVTCAATLASGMHTVPMCAPTLTKCAFGRMRAASRRTMSGDHARPSSSVFSITSRGLRISYTTPSTSTVVCPRHTPSARKMPPAQSARKEESEPKPSRSITRCSRLPHFPPFPVFCFLAISIFFWTGSQEQKALFWGSVLGI